MGKLTWIFISWRTFKSPDFPHVFAVTLHNNEATIGPYKFNLDFRTHHHHSFIFRGVSQNFTVRAQAEKAGPVSVCAFGVFISTAVHTLWAYSCLLVFTYLLADRIFDLCCTHHGVNGKAKSSVRIKKFSTEIFWRNSKWNFICKYFSMINIQW